MLTDAHWMRLEPLIEACRPKGKTPFGDGRQGYSAPKARQRASIWGMSVHSASREAGGLERLMHEAAQREV
jgi:hypothetical protein